MPDKNTTITTESYLEEIGEPHEMTGALKEQWKWWRVVLRQGYGRYHRQVSKDCVRWKDVD